MYLYLLFIEQWKEKKRYNGILCYCIIHSDGKEREREGKDR